MIEDDEFYAWLDDELEGEAEARVAAQVAASPELSARAEEHRRLGAGLRAAFDPVMAESSTLPRFQTAPVIDLGAEAVRKDGHRQFGIPQWAAMAATLALGLVVGNIVGDRPGAPVQNRDGSLVAAASLDRALDEQLASNGPSNDIRLGLTFRNRNG
jgi:anti-sigma factor RsiW